MSKRVTWSTAATLAIWLMLPYVLFFAERHSSSGAMSIVLMIACGVVITFWRPRTDQDRQ